MTEKTNNWYAKAIDIIASPMSDETLLSIAMDYSKRHPKALFELLGPDDGLDKHSDSSKPSTWYARAISFFASAPAHRELFDVAIDYAKRHPSGFVSVYHASARATGVGADERLVTPNNINPQIKSFLMRGQNLHAIKERRNQTGETLEAAAAYIDRAKTVLGLE